jgi:hypothetical protein
VNICLKKIQGNNPRRLEDLKHKKEKVLPALTKKKTVGKFAKRHEKKMLFFKNVGDISIICCSYTFL